MPEPRFFVGSKLSAGMLVALENADARHARTVLRSRPGDSLTLLSESVAWDAEFASVENGDVIARAVKASNIQNGELSFEVTVLQAVTKGAKFDEVVEKTVELGAARIVPVICARTESAGGSNKVDRWRRISRTAAMQSRRRIVPAIEEPVALRTALVKWAQNALTLLAYEKAGHATLSTALARHNAGMPIVIAVGPEGGLTLEEVEQAQELGAAIVSLGPTILRTETAAAALLAAVSSKLGSW